MGSRSSDQNMTLNRVKTGFFRTGGFYHEFTKLLLQSVFRWGWCWYMRGSVFQLFYSGCLSTRLGSKQFTEHLRSSRQNDSFYRKNSQEFFQPQRTKKLALNIDTKWLIRKSNDRKKACFSLEVIAEFTERNSRDNCSVSTDFIALYKRCWKTIKDSTPSLSNHTRIDWWELKCISKKNN